MAMKMAYENDDDDDGTDTNLSVHRDWQPLNCKVIIQSGQSWVASQSAQIFRLLIKMIFKIIIAILDYNLHSWVTMDSIVVSVFVNIGWVGQLQYQNKHSYFWF